MITHNRLNAEARRLAKVLEARDLKIVFAESCTGGLVSASLTRVPGISASHCGSAVVYREATKAGWLGISPEILEKHGAVSRAVAAEMATRVLAKTPEAHVSAAVTGHIGPGAPPRQDGLVFMSVALRKPSRRNGRPQVVVKRLRLETETDGGSPRNGQSLRIRRQREAAHALLLFVRSQLEKLPA